MVAEVGYQVATLEMIAARAGVGTATIYRRHTTKRDLLAAALRAGVGEFTAPRCSPTACRRQHAAYAPAAV